MGCYSAGVGATHHTGCECHEDRHAAEVRGLKEALGEIAALGDVCEDCEVHAAPMATHVTQSPVTGIPVFLCAEHAEDARAAHRKAESKGCGKQPDVEVHEQELAVTIALEALARAATPFTRPASGGSDGDG
jgi:hypothetical protein